MTQITLNPGQLQQLDAGPTLVECCDSAGKLVGYLHVAGSNDPVQAPAFTPVTTLGPRPFQVIRPIFAVVREDDGAFVAFFADANINASGDTRTEALEMLKDSLASRFRFFTEHEADLGDEPQRQLAVLREFLRAR
jgi:predicted RNase H-like HicB family nuclease